MMNGGHLPHTSSVSYHCAKLAWHPKDVGEVKEKDKEHKIK
jgi:hypothetical protein